MTNRNQLSRCKQSNPKTVFLEKRMNNLDFTLAIVREHTLEIKVLRCSR
jgi:hypothetical protein